MWMIKTRLKAILGLLLLAIFVFTVSLVGGHPTEAGGIVTNVVDGDTFDVIIAQSDRGLLEDTIRVKLADVRAPDATDEAIRTELAGVRAPEPMCGEAGQASRDATNFTKAALDGEWVYLDLDDKTGCAVRGMWSCVVYLQNATEGQALEPVYPCFNRMLVDAGHGEVSNGTTNEFNSLNWWLDTNDVPGIGDFGLALIYNGIYKYDGVLDAAIVQNGKTLSLALIVDYGTSEVYAKEVADSFVRITKSFTPDVGPRNEIGPGIYDYLIGVFRPDGTTIVLGAKAFNSRSITW